MKRKGLRSFVFSLKNDGADSVLPVAALGVLILLIGAYLLMYKFYVPLQDLYEDVSFALFPSGQKAYSYGELHFNGQDPSEYDVNRAARYFQAALALDPSLTYVHHEIARTFFLRGDFGDAMLQIDIQIAQEGDKTPNSYYVRGLIEGYIGDYADSAKDYEQFLRFDPHNWAGINDYAWVLMKAGRYADAAKATGDALTYFPENAWLLNNNAIALYETGHLKEALPIAQRAIAAGEKLTEADWLHAYPGNDPKIAGQGIDSFNKAAADNVHSIELAIASSTVQ